ncbi:MAG: amino acid ABC transporter substrate-binding protein [Gammaproteobacteria bacterium]|nr:amino acid ABC transporter substrate-binding protein [Gammaproteobacteria bacterium]
MRLFNCFNKGFTYLNYLLFSLAIVLSNKAFTQDARYDEPTLDALSLEELMNIPLNTDYSKHQIYQSDINPIDENTINFGLIVPISQFPLYSAEVVAAADLATLHINNNGGILGNRLAILRADDYENTPVSAALAQRLATEFNVKALLGPATSDSVADVLQKVAIPNNIPLISHAASTMALTEIGGQHAFWRMVANNAQQVELMFNFLLKKTNHRNVYIISGRELYSEEIRSGLIEKFKQAKETQINYYAVSNLVRIESMDLEDEIKAIQSSGATAIVMTVQNAQVIPMINKIKKHWNGPFPMILLGDNVTPKYLTDASLGKISECIMTYVASPKELSNELKRNMKKKLKFETAMFDAAYIYDATILLAMGLEISEFFNIPVKTAIESITADGYAINHDDYSNILTLVKKHKELSFTGYSGRVHFNGTGDNLAASMTIYPIVHSEQAPDCLKNR